MSSNDQPWGIHWFRRDLRVIGNLALMENHRRTGGRTLGLFCFDSSFLSRDDFSHNRFAFFLETLKVLRKDLKSLGGDLLVVDCLPQKAFPQLIEHARGQKHGAPQIVTFGRDYEPFARRRDDEITTLLQKHDVEVFNDRDHLLFEPHEVLKDDGAFYRVYSPWARKWFDKLSSAEGKKRLAASLEPIDGKFHLKWSDRTPPLDDRLDDFTAKNGKHVRVPIPDAGHAAALSVLDDFKTKIAQYHQDRDVPARLATAGISMYLKNGSVTLAQIFKYLKLDHKRPPGPQKFAQELAWREFFYNVLFHRPEVEGNAFNPKYRDVEWPGDEDRFRLWCEGKTGVPIVDAGMRQLATDGWITNRMRIITATFLIKDLEIDWRKGELHFMHLLLDGDTANNNGNWQWCASTGAEAQPYFRILNPWTQGERFDPTGDYIRQHVPELKDAPAKTLHDVAADRTGYGGYPAPIVDHAVQRPRAIALFKK